MAVGGDITGATWAHPTLGSGKVDVKAGEDSTYDTGGYRSSDEASMIDGSGNMIDQMNRVRPSFELTGVNDMSAQTIEKIAALAGSPVPATWTFSVINGTTYQLKGKPVGDLQPNVNQSTFKLKVAGSNKATQII